MISKFNHVAALVAVIALAASGCGGSGSDSSEPNDTAGQPANTAATADPVTTEPALPVVTDAAAASGSDDSSTTDVVEPVTPAIDLGAAVDAARNEGPLLVYGNANDNQMQPILDAFRTAYDIPVEYLSLGSSETFQRYLSESSTGATTADVIVDSDAAGILDLVDRGEILDYVDPNLVDLPTFAQLAPGVVAMSEDPLIATFNTKLVPLDQQPTTLAELAEFSMSNSGRVATYEIENSLGYGGNYAYLDANGEQGWEVLEQLGPNTKAEQSAGVTIGKVLQGEYVAAYFQSGAIRALIDGDSASVANWRYLSDATPTIPRGIAVTAASPSPNAAQVFVNFVLSVEGQTAACAGGFTPYREGVECEFDLQSIEDAVGAENVLVGTYDPQMVADRDAIVARWNAAFGR